MAREVFLKLSVYDKKIVVTCMPVPPVFGSREQMASIDGLNTLDRL